MTSRPAIETVSHQASFAYALWFSGAAGVLLLASIMSTGAERQVSLPGFGVLPESCTLHTRLGMDCPGCGLTRCFIHLAHGEVSTACQLNPVGLGLFAFVAWQLPLALGMLCSAQLATQHRIILRRLVMWNQLALVGLMIALIVQWFIRLWAGIWI